MLWLAIILNGTNGIGPASFYLVPLSKPSILGFSMVPEEFGDDQVTERLLGMEKKRKGIVMISCP
jgi:hypothetical protein